MIKMNYKVLILALALIFGLLLIFMPTPQSQKNYSKEEWMQIITEIQDEHEYNLDMFNCLDYSKDAVNQLRKKGINSDIVEIYNCSISKANCKGHAKIAIRMPSEIVYIDPQNSRVYTAEDFIGKTTKYYSWVQD
jgi:hypothetical protein